LSLLAAWILRGNKVVSIFPQFISNAGTMLPLAILQYRLGSWFWPAQTADATESLLAAAMRWDWASPWESLRQVFSSLGALGANALGPLTVGVLLSGLAMSLLSYPLTIIAVRTWHARRRSRRLAKGRPVDEDAPGVGGVSPAPLAIEGGAVLRYSEVRLEPMTQGAQGMFQVLPAGPRLEESGGGLLVRAPAKINLDLLVGPRRADGYHDLDSLVAKVTLYDEVRLLPRRDGRIGFSCAGADCGADEDNLALRAARVLDEALPPGRGNGVGVDIRLVKHIPPGKGLGGGSSDAAAVLVGLNRIWDLRLSPAELASLGPMLGSDVPLFFGPPALRMTGRGERIEPVTVHPFVAVLYVPAFSCSTADVYRAVDEATESGFQSPALARRDLDARVLSDQPPSQWRGLLRNDLSSAARLVQPELSRAWQNLAGRVAPPVLMTGSGSTLLVLCDDEDEARTVLAEMGEDLRPQCLVVQQNPW
jgi:4-diphosphocytidyl-2-C-methyl-D-erythritol kinase